MCEDAVILPNKTGGFRERMGKGWTYACVSCAGARMCVSILMHVKQNNKFPNHKTDASGNAL